MTCVLFLKIPVSSTSLGPAHTYLVMLTSLFEEEISIRYLEVIVVVLSSLTLTGSWRSTVEGPIGRCESRYVVGWVKARTS